VNPQNEQKALELLARGVTALEKIVVYLQDAQELHGAILRVQAQIESHEMRLSRTEEDVESTGEIYVDDLKKKLTTYENSQAHWVRYVVGVGVSLLMVLVSVGIGYVLRK